MISRESPVDINSVFLLPGKIIFTAAKMLDLTDKYGVLMDRNHFMSIY